MSFGSSALGPLVLKGCNILCSFGEFLSFSRFCLCDPSINLGRFTRRAREVDATRVRILTFGTGWHAGVA
jgi:hypothetical protein